MTIDSITLDMIENSLKNIRNEMDAIVYRSAMSPLVREQHDEFPMICDREGKMVVGQFGSHIPAIVEQFKGGLQDGDVILLSDPYLCAGSISHANDWLVIIPIYYDKELVGYSSMFGQMMDIGGVVPGSQPSEVKSIYAEGIRIPPLKLIDKGILNRPLLDMILNNVRTPEMNESDLMALIAGCRTGAERVIELCERFGKETYIESCDLLLNRTKEAMEKLIKKMIPTEKIKFTDFIDDDGVGNGPFKIELTMWRQNGKAYFDFTGTDPQAEGSINLHLNDGLCKMFIGIYLIMAYDPEIMFNDGFYELIDIHLPEGSILNPKEPAPLSNRLSTKTRLFDVLSGALGFANKELSIAAGYGTSPFFVYSGYKENGEYFQMVDLLFGGVPGRPIGDGLDAHSWWPLFNSTASEYLETYYPIIVEEYTIQADTGGPGKHRGGAGLQKRYKFLADGEISFNDDRWLTNPWGVNGGMPGGVSSKILIKKNGEQIELKSKKDMLKVEAGDSFIFNTAGAGGWGNPLERDYEKVRLDVISNIVTVENAKSDYGVILKEGSLEVDIEQSKQIRKQKEKEIGKPLHYNFGKKSNELRSKYNIS